MNSLDGYFVAIHINMCAAVISDIEVLHAKDLIVFFCATYI